MLMCSAFVVLGLFKCSLLVVCVCPCVRLYDVPRRGYAWCSLLALATDGNSFLKQPLLRGAI